MLNQILHRGSTTRRELEQTPSSAARSPRRRGPDVAMKTKKNSPFRAAKVRSQVRSPKTLSLGEQMTTPTHCAQSPKQVDIPIR
jgi:hypothetical protein